MTAHRSRRFLPPPSLRAKTLNLQIYATTMQTALPLETTAKSLPHILREHQQMFQAAEKADLTFGVDSTPVWIGREVQQPISAPAGVAASCPAPRISCANGSPEALPGSSVIPGASSARARHIPRVPVTTWLPFPTLRIRRMRSHPARAASRASSVHDCVGVATLHGIISADDVLCDILHTARRKDLLGYMRPDCKSVRDKKAEERFSAMLAESPKSSVLYDITPDGIYTKDTDTTTRPVLTSRGSLNLNSRISNPNHKVMLAAQNFFDTEIFSVVCM